jgi:hypothetical protein
MSAEDVQQHEREVRAARNQAMFRMLNERLAEARDALDVISSVHEIACECADTTCIQSLRIPADEYEEVRNEPNHFAVLPGHVYPDVEFVVRETDGYVVVEKVADASLIAEALDPRAG